MRKKIRAPRPPPPGSNATVDLTVKDNPSVFVAHDCDGPTVLAGLDHLTRVYLLSGIRTVMHDRQVFDPFNPGRREQFIEFAALRMCWKPSSRTERIFGSFSKEPFAGTWPKGRMLAEALGYADVIPTVTAKNLPKYLSLRLAELEPLVRRPVWLPAHELLWGGVVGVARHGVTKIPVGKEHWRTTWELHREAMIPDAHGNSIAWGHEQLRDLLGFYNVGRTHRRNRGWGYLIDYRRFEWMYQQLENPGHDRSLGAGLCYSTHDYMSRHVTVLKDDSMFPDEP